MPVAQCFTKDTIAHGMCEDIDAFQAGVVFGIGIRRTSPGHELLEHSGKRKGALIRRLLIVPVVFHHAEIVIAGPDDRNHQDLAILLLVMVGCLLVMKSMWISPSGLWIELTSSGEGSKRYQKRLFDTNRASSPGS